HRRRDPARLWRPRLRDARADRNDRGEAGAVRRRRRQDAFRAHRRRSRQAAAGQMSAAPIPVNAPLLDGNEAKYLAECVRTGWISSEGPYIRQFEEQFAARVGRRHGIAVTNGSAALDAAVAALGIGPGDEVILPAFTIISCATAVVRAGATPVLVDCDPQTWNMTADAVAAR